METDRLKAEGLKLNGFIRGISTAWWPEGPADNSSIKTKLIITLTISYQFQTLIQRIDTEFYCGSRGMVFKLL